MASKLYAVLSWLLVALGVFHMVSAFSIYAALTMPALWFFGGGIVIVMGAMLNLLNRAYGQTARGLRIATIVTNFTVGCFAAAGGILSGAGVLALVVVLGLYVVITVLSATRSAQKSIV